MLAHQVSHLSNNDVFVKLVSDVISRITNVMSTTGYILILIYSTVCFDGNKGAMDVAGRTDYGAYI